MQIVGKGFTIEEFEKYVYSLKFNGWTPKFVVVHNTSEPSQKLYKDWHNRPNWTGEQWMKNLASYYTGLGWSAGPHLFVGYDLIWVFSPLTSRGTHTPSWNSISWGVETIAEFDNEEFSDGVKTNLIEALAILHNRIGLNPADFKLGVSGIHFHKEDKNTTHKDCPGKNLIKSQLVADVVNYMNKNESSHVHIPEYVQSADTEDMTTEELTSIKWLQQKLNNSGIISPKLTVDGILGDKTKAAVKIFQAKNNLTVDGIAGPLTRKELKKI